MLILEPFICARKCANGPSNFSSSLSLYVVNADASDLNCVILGGLSPIDCFNASNNERLLNSSHFSFVDSVFITIEYPSVSAVNEGQYLENISAS